MCSSYAILQIKMNLEHSFVPLSKRGGTLRRLKSRFNFLHLRVMLLYFFRCIEGLPPFASVMRPTVCLPHGHVKEPCSGESVTPIFVAVCKGGEKPPVLEIDSAPLCPTGLRHPSSPVNGIIDAPPENRFRYEKL